MPYYLNVEDLAVDLNKTVPQTRKQLRAAAVPVEDGWVRTAHYDAAYSADYQVLMLSSHSGLGAIQGVLAKCNLRILRHDYIHNHLLWIGTSQRKVAYTKVYHSRRLRNRTTAGFRVTGFKRNNAPQYYLFFCLEAKQIWVITRRQLLAAHRKILKTGCLDLDERGLSIPHLLRDHAGGVLDARLSTKHHEYLLQDKSQLGL